MIQPETSRWMMRPSNEDDMSDLYKMMLDIEVIKYTGDLPFNPNYALENLLRTEISSKPADNTVRFW